MDLATAVKSVRPELRALAQQRFDGVLSEKALQTRLRTMVWQVRARVPEAGTDLIYLALRNVAKAHWQTLVKDYLVRSAYGARCVAHIGSVRPALSRDEVSSERAQELAEEVVKEEGMVRAGATYEELFPVAQDRKSTRLNSSH
jgi:hypothetical protein